MHRMGNQGTKCKTLLCFVLFSCFHRASQHSDPPQWTSGRSIVTDTNTWTVAAEGTFCLKWDLLPFFCVCCFVCCVLIAVSLFIVLQYNCAKPWDTAFCFTNRLDFVCQKFGYYLQLNKSFSFQKGIQTKASIIVAGKYQKWLSTQKAAKIVLPG